MTDDCRKSSALRFFCLASSYTTSFLNFLMAHLYLSGTRDSPTKLSASQMTSGHGSLSLLHTDITKRATRVLFCQTYNGPEKLPWK